MVSKDSEAGEFGVPFGARNPNNALSEPEIVDQLPLSLNRASAVNSFRRTGVGLRLLPAFVLVVGRLPVGSQLQSSSKSSTSKPSWVLTWSDEFNSPIGSAPDPAKWVVELHSFLRSRRPVSVSWRNQAITVTSGFVMKWRFYVNHRKVARVPSRNAKGSAI